MNIVVLISGSGSNLLALVEACKTESLPINIKAVVSNRAAAYGLEHARDAQLETVVVDHQQFPSREIFDQALCDAIDPYQPDFIFLAGFMRMLTPVFIQHFAHRILNIHPSRLPLYKGLNTHQRVLNDNESKHGASVHLVTQELDDGPVILQSELNVLPNESTESLAQRVLQTEHIIFPLALQWLAEKRLFIRGDGQVELDGHFLSKPVQIKFEK